MRERSRRAAGWLYGAVAVLWPLLTLATWLVNAPMLAALPGRPLAWLSALLAVGGLLAVRLGLRGDRPLLAFLGSCAFLAGMLAATAACVFPVMLRAIGDDSLSLSAYNASVPATSLRTALGWWVIGAPLAVAYFVVLFRLHRGKVVAAQGRDGLTRRLRASVGRRSADGSSLERGPGPCSATRHGPPLSRVRRPSRPRLLA